MLRALNKSGFNSPQSFRLDSCRSLGVAMISWLELGMYASTGVAAIVAGTAAGPTLRRRRQDAREQRKEPTNAADATPHPTAPRRGPSAPSGARADRQ